MKAARMTNTELAERAQINRHTITRWRKGEIQRPDCDKVRLCADPLELTPEQLAVLLKAAKCGGAEQNQVFSEELTFSTFVPGHPVIRPEQFSGREALLELIFRKWEKFPLQNISIVGERGLGKTSLLNFLLHRIPKRLGEEYQAILVDFKEARMRTQSHLLNYILKSLGKISLTDCTLIQFEEILEQQGITRPTIILMDDIEHALGSGELDVHFWWGLRSLQHTRFEGRLGVLMTSSKPPGQVADEKQKPSPFFNVFGFHAELKKFTREEAWKLMDLSPFPFSERDRNWMFEHSEGRPDQLQRYCAALLLALEEGDTSKNWQQLMV